MVLRVRRRGTGSARRPVCRARRQLPDLPEERLVGAIGADHRPGRHRHGRCPYVPSLPAHPQDRHARAVPRPEARRIHRRSSDADGPRGRLDGQRTGLQPLAARRRCLRRRILPQDPDGGLLVRPAPDPPVPGRGRVQRRPRDHGPDGRPGREPWGLRERHVRGVRGHPRQPTRSQVRSDHVLHPADERPELHGRRVGQRQDHDLQPRFVRKGLGPDARGRSQHQPRTQRGGRQRVRRSDRRDGLLLRRRRPEDMLQRRQKLAAGMVQRPDPDQQPEEPPRHADIRPERDLGLQRESQRPRGPAIGAALSRLRFLHRLQPQERDQRRHQGGRGHGHRPAQGLRSG
mmetsp:Transcript_21328/g.50754  ORF Transcript_21328/g.50754 Transcript_21328/m.50754 type:complete len:345 (+) Transcript_21328:299-1333(+)